MHEPSIDEKLLAAADERRGAWKVLRKIYPKLKELEKAYRDMRVEYFRWSGVYHRADKMIANLNKQILAPPKGKKKAKKKDVVVGIDDLQKMPRSKLESLLADLEGD